MHLTRRVGAVAAATLTAIVLLPVASPAPVLAHAQLVASSPGAGSVLPEAPAEIRLVFSEPLESQVTSLDVLTGDGTAVVTSAGEIDPDDDRALVADLPELEDGVYEVRWRTLSAADGHTAQGAFTFGVGDIGGALPAADAGAMVHTQADPNRVVGRWLTYPGLLLAVGIPAFFALVVRRHMPRAALRALAIGLSASALASLLIGVAGGIEAGSVLDYLFGTRNGGLQVGRALVTAIGAAAVLLLPQRAAPLAAVATGLAGIGLLVVAGHAAAQPEPATAITGVVHVAGTAVWVGGIIGLLAMALRPDLIGAPDLTFRTAIPRFSAMALVSIGLVLLTGAYAAWVHNGSLLDPGSDYGLVLVLKTVLALGALALGGLNYLDGGRALGWLGGLVTRLQLETGLIGGVLVASAVLALTSPDTPTAVVIEPVPDAFGEVTPGMNMELAPGRPGVNRVVVVTDPGLGRSVELELVLDDLQAGTTTRVPLLGEEMAGMDHSGMGTAADDGRAQWMADAIVLRPDSAWDANVVIASSAGDELTRQRFAFTLDESGVADGVASAAFDPVAAIGVLLLVGGALGVGLGLGGVTLPRTEPVASRISLLTGGTVSLVLGTSIGVSRLLLG